MSDDAARYSGVGGQPLEQALKRGAVTLGRVAPTAALAAEASGALAATRGAFTAAPTAALASLAAAEASGALAAARGALATTRGAFTAAPTAALASGAPAARGAFAATPYLAHQMIAFPGARGAPAPVAAPTAANVARWTADAEAYLAAHGATPAPVADEDAPFAREDLPVAARAPAALVGPGRGAPFVPGATPGVRRYSTSTARVSTGLPGVAGTPKHTRGIRYASPALFVPRKLSDNDVATLETFFPTKNEKLESIELVPYPGQNPTHTYRDPDRQYNYMLALQQRLMELSIMEPHEYPGPIEKYEEEVNKIKLELSNQGERVKQAAPLMKNVLTKYHFANIIPTTLMLREAIFNNNPNERTLYLLGIILSPEEVHNYGRRIPELFRLLPNNFYYETNVKIKNTNVTQLLDYVRSLIYPNLSGFPEWIKTKIIRNPKISNLVRLIASFGIRIPKNQETYIVNVEHPNSLREIKDGTKEALEELVVRHRNRSDPESKRIIELLTNPQFLKDLLADLYYASNLLPYTYVADTTLNKALDTLHVYIRNLLLPTNTYERNREIYIAEAQKVNPGGIQLDAAGAAALYDIREDHAENFSRIMLYSYQKSKERRNPSNTSPPEAAVVEIYEEIGNKIKDTVNPSQRTPSGGGNILGNKNLLSFALLAFLENPLPSEIDEFTKIDPSKIFTDNPGEYEIYGKKYKKDEMPPIIFPPKSLKQNEVVYSKEDEVVYEKAAKVLKDLIFGDLDKNNYFVGLNLENTELPPPTVPSYPSFISGTSRVFNNLRRSELENSTKLPEAQLRGGKLKSKKTRKHRSKKHKRYSRKK